ncbi:MAG: glutamate racemase [Fusobacteriaceae bacterium]
MSSNGSIGIFDSGVGGTTVLKEIIKLLPKENIIYFGDNKNSPYGEKTAEKIQEHCLRTFKFLLEKNCKVVVIACNTATAAAIDILTKKSGIPVIGVISGGVKAALKVTQNGKIGILATPFTVSSMAYVKEFEKKRKIEIQQSPCKKLCPMIETGWEKFKNRKQVLYEYLNVFNKDIDTLILACTHYPIIREDIEELYKGNIVDTAKETAMELLEILNKKEILNKSQELGTIEFYINGELENFKSVAEKILKMKILNIKKIFL